MSEREKREDRVARLRAAGVEIPDGNSVYIGEEVVVEAGAVIWPNNHVYGRSHIAAGAVLEPNNVIFDSEIGAGSTVLSSVLRGAKVGSNVSVGRTPICGKRA